MNRIERWKPCSDISTTVKTVLQNLDEIYGLLVNPKKKKKKKTRNEMKRKEKKDGDW